MVGSRCRGGARLKRGWLFTADGGEDDRVRVFDICLRDKVSVEGNVMFNL